MVAERVGADLARHVHAHVHVCMCTCVLTDVFEALELSGAHVARLLGCVGRDRASAGGAVLNLETVLVGLCEILIRELRRDDDAPHAARQHRRHAGALIAYDGELESGDGGSVAERPSVRSLPIHSAVDLCAVSGASGGHDIIYCDT